MKKITSLKQELLKEAIDKYVERSYIDSFIVEKDLWNCYFLDYLFNRSKYKDFFIFKGGTSLSKCYDLINRYSEDLDVVLDSSIFGINLEEKMEVLASRNQKEKYIDDVNEKAMDFIEKELIPQMQEDCEKELNKELVFDLDKENLAFFVTYPRTSVYNYVSPTIKIEMSSLSAIIPFEIKKVEPYINAVVIDEYKTEFNVKCMMPKRTFWEKALILHQEANRVNGAFPSRYSRHYYDLYQIYNSDIWNETKNDLKLLDEVRKFTITFYNRSWSKFEEAKPGTFKLVPNEKYIDELRKDYELMSQMIFGDKPTFEEVMLIIAKIEKEINEL